MSIETGIAFDHLVDLDERIIITYTDVLQERNEQQKRASRRRR